MAFDAFVQIDGIAGESTDHQHPGWIEALAVGTQVRQTISSTVSSAGGATAERANFDTFNFSKFVDKATPLLMQACASGTVVKQIQVELYRAGPERVKYMAYTLTNSIIKSVFTNSGDPKNGFPVDLVKISYGKIQWRYTQQRRQGGGVAGHIAAGWDLQRNCVL